MADEGGINTGGEKTGQGHFDSGSKKIQQK
jgi:hypothetical protein